MQGKRVENIAELEELTPGEYWKRQDGVWFARTPDGRLANLSEHNVEELPDGTITVYPSILVVGGGFDGSWHGWLEAGIWRKA